MLRLLVLLFCLWGGAAVAAPITAYPFDDPEKEEDFKELITELRCLVCQNQSIGDSNAELAQDLRDEVYRMLQAGQSRAEIVDFMVARYGDFVLYSPPVRSSTLFLWVGPFIFLAVIGFFLFRSIANRKTVVAQEPKEYSDADRQRMKDLLNQVDEEDKDKNKDEDKSS